MSSMYELEENWKQVANMLYDEEIDEQMIFDTLEAIEGNIEDKAVAYAKIMREMEAMEKARKEEANRMERSAKVLENRRENLKQRLFNAMKTTGKTKFNTKLFGFSIVKNGGKQKITIDKEVPAEYTKIKIENDTDKIRQALEAGEELSFAHLEPRGERLSIK